MSGYARRILLVVAVVTGTGAGTRGQETRAWATLQGYAGLVDVLTFSPDGRTVASGDRDGNIKLWEVASGKLRATWRGHTKAVTAVAFSPGGKVLASGGDDEVVRLWDAAGKGHRILHARVEHLADLAFSPDGKGLAVVGRVPSGKRGVGELQLWDVRTGRRQRTHLGNMMFAVAFSPEGRELAAGDDDGVTVWEAETGKDRSRLKGPGHLVTSVAYLPGGGGLASAGSDRTVRLWDLRAGRERAKLEGHTDWVQKIALTNGGKLLASASHDGSVRLWDTASGKELLTLEQGTAVWCVAFSPDGKTLAVGVDRNVKLWSVTKLLGQK
jgi:WD40 repeat protein